MDVNRRYTFKGLMERLSSDAWAVGRIKVGNDRAHYFFMPAEFRKYGLAWRNGIGR